MTVRLTVYHTLMDLGEKESNETLSYYNFSPDFNQHRQEKYIDTGKIISFTSLSNEDIQSSPYPNALDGVEIIFKDEDAKYEYAVDPIIQENLKFRNKQYRDCGISTISVSINS